MQLLYSLDRDPGVKAEEILKRYDQSVDLAYESLLFNLFLLIEIFHQSVADRDTRQAKFRPSADDPLWNAKLYENPLVRSLVENQSLQTYFNKRFGARKPDQDLMIKIYKTFAKSPEYRTYVLEEMDEAAHRAFILGLYRDLRKNEIFEEIIDEHYSFWLEDKSLVIGAIKKIIKQLPVSNDKFFEEYLPDHETVTEYGRRLIEITIEQADELERLIQPTLKNWEMERLAILDVILIKMALVEFIYFPTIPTKVTLDEYVDISKEYSTPKSKDFVNGILDTLMKTLQEEGKINKEGRGLLED